jgi:hypothetical protein
MTEQRRFAAIVSADVAGYSRLMGRDETGTGTVVAFPQVGGLHHRYERRAA